MDTLPLEVTRAASDLRAIIGRLTRRLRQMSIGGDEMTLSQASVLSLIMREGPVTPGMLAARERISPQSMGAILVSLEALGLISRTPDPNDGRCLVISLTETGIQAIQGARQHKEERLARALADHFSEQEQQTLIAALPLLDRLSQLV
jgi:DNA-binding MarR family transcriptional regulator